MFFKLNGLLSAQTTATISNIETGEITLQVSVRIKSPNDIEMNIQIIDL